MHEPVKAAQYVRMSTERQDFSIELQKAVIAGYAEARNYEVVRTYEDRGISGLSFDRRPGLKALLADVVSGAAGFSIILVYDVSRWGRFQNPDQSAHYEFLCTEAGVRIEYCAEPFENDGSAVATLLKSLKRAMAAEYSRELSAKVKRARDRLQDLGFWVSGLPGYGLRRQVVTRAGKVLAIRECGERKVIFGSYVKLVWGPPEEVRTLRRIYRLFARSGMSMRAIAALLNRENVRPERSALWTAHQVSGVLTSPKYSGELVRTRHVPAIGANSVRLPEGAWTRRPAPFKPMVSKRLAAEVKLRIAERDRVLTDAELLDDLRAILHRHGQLSISLMRQEARATLDTYYGRFRDLLTAYRLAGHEPTPAQVRMSTITGGTRFAGTAQPRASLTREELVRRLRELHTRQGRLSLNLIIADPNLPDPAAIRRRFRSMHEAYRLAGFEPDGMQRKRLEKRAPPPPG